MRRLKMNPSLAAKSLILFGISLLFLVLLTLFESLLIDMAGPAERILSVVLLILPGIAGVVFGALSLRRSETKTGMAIAGIILNVLFLMFHVFLLSFAG
jgi:uncharacterized membrane protein